jgi:hypothetical protein
MRRRRLPRGMFGSEAELCHQFVSLARQAGCQVHCEVDAWDIVLVSSAGVQIGIQAKLRASIDVLSQALRDERQPGPEVHAVLVPVASYTFLDVAQAARVFVFQGVLVDERFDFMRVFETAPRWKHKKPTWVPEVQVITPAGVPAPKSVTPWKMGAVKLCLLARSRGYVTRADLKAFKLHETWWFDRKFGPMLSPREHNGVRVRGEYVLFNPENPKSPDLRWPEIVDALALARQRRDGPRFRIKRQRAAQN